MWLPPLLVFFSSRDEAVHKNLSSCEQKKKWGGGASRAGPSFWSTWTNRVPWPQGSSSPPVNCFDSYNDEMIDQRIHCPAVIVATGEFVFVYILSCFNEGLYSSIVVVMREKS